MSLSNIQMNTKDFREKAKLDAGGFGMVSLRYHRTHGLVVLKTVYTGPQRTDYSASLLEEGMIMHSLKHDHVVKLLGIILEDGNYSLVLEYAHKWNLMAVLKATTVPSSVKGRVILEINEGMLYLAEQDLVHKDLKPENVLVDDDFHINIADLGVACFKSWSRLTKEETIRQKKTNSISKSNSGTLFYMAPEHLRSINAKPVEKSDVYSFGIVNWAIFANKEPYEYAINETHICFAIMNGNRPDIAEITENCPTEIIKLMECCWKQEPEARPTFAEINQTYKPFYQKIFEPHIEDDVKKLKKVFPGPPELMERMQSLQIDAVTEPQTNNPADQPNSLHSSQGPMTNYVDEAMFAAVPQNQPVESCETSFEAAGSLQRKLLDEFNYHVYGSRMDKSDSQPAVYSAEMREEERRRRVSYDPFANGSATPCTQESYLNAENSGLKASPYNSVTSNNHLPQESSAAASPVVEKFPYNPNIAFGAMPADLIATASTEDIYRSNSANTSTPNKPPVPESGPEQQAKPYTHIFPRSLSSEKGKMESNPFKKGNFAYSSPAPISRINSEEPPQYNIYNSTGIQIGTYNYMEIEDHSLPINCTPVNSQKYCTDYDKLLGSTTLLSEKHLNLVRDNLAKHWKRCARKLGFSDPEIDEIDHDYERDGLKEKVYQMLQRWLMREGLKGATVGKLAKALFECQRLDLLNGFILINQE
uniref:Receptor interacting serine/threonine kinase 1 n=1 Tax=Sphenodon punctatus TaxID=8508 RepID=A0A8D0HNQ0_SPHPU